MTKLANDDTKRLSQIELVAELDNIRPAERLDNYSMPLVPKEEVRLPQLGIEEVHTDEQN